MASKLGVEEEMEECIGGKERGEGRTWEGTFPASTTTKTGTDGRGRGGKEEEEHRLPPYSRRTGSAVFPEYGDKQ